MAKIVEHIVGIRSIFVHSKMSLRNDWHFSKADEPSSGGNKTMKLLRGNSEATQTELINYNGKIMFIYHKKNGFMRKALYAVKTKEIQANNYY